MNPKKLMIAYFVLFFSLVTARNSYKQLAQFLSNTTIDSFCAIQNDKLKVAIGTRVGISFAVRIYSISQTERTLKLHQILAPFQAQQIYARFSGNGQSLIILCNKETIRSYRINQKNHNQQFQLVQVLELAERISKISICQRNEVVIVTKGRLVIIYSDDDQGKIVKRSQYLHNAQVIALSISPDGKWLSISSMYNLQLLKLDGDFQPENLSSTDIQDDFQIQFIITTENGQKIFLIDEDNLVGDSSDGGSIRIFETDFNAKTLIKKQHFENFTDFTRSLSVSDNGNILAFFSQHNRIWIFVKSQENKNKSKSYQMLQSFNANQSVLNHLWLTRYGQYMILSDQRGSISIFKDMQMQDGSALITITVIIIAACIIGAVIYYYKRRQTGYSFEESNYFQLKQQKK